MRYAIWMCLAAASANGYAQERGWEPQFLRRITLAAACAASFWDYHTTAESAAYGAVEKNALLANDQGRPRLGLIFGLKAGICGISAALQEERLLGRWSDKSATPLWISVNLALTTTFSATALHNLAVTRTLQQQKQPAIPAYLAATQDP